MPPKKYSFVRIHALLTLFDITQESLFCSKRAICQYLGIAFLGVFSLARVKGFWEEFFVASMRLRNGKNRQIKNLREEGEVILAKKRICNIKNMILAKPRSMKYKRKIK